MRLLLAAALLWPAPVLASEAWESVRDQLYPGRVLQDGGAVIALDVPYRTPDDARTQMAARIRAPEGLRLGEVTVVLDENPMPVSAVFTLDAPQERFFFDVTMRVNGPTPVHVVAETTDGQLFVTEGYVKTSGQGACAAPPGTDPKLALASLGRMELSVDGGTGDTLAALRARVRRLDIDLSHPSLSGMQKDQITLLFIPMRYVETLDVELDGAAYATVTGSISLSEDPRVSLSVPLRTQSVAVTMTDTDGTVTRAGKDLPGF
ncbi:quinoprotein dehydrogenase-associated SoxYZ-like carrier [Palleronia rufa]|uniref:quinoprotein dehydrogenase-associated SoxYZ-like carrier n=1 Tax=Palleronia rufa TaxID=1530186 RepID=UPI0005627B86|nr:quinoprotein dehydrogenase-associated SoxYZ-like carrier [Palleronia rufa]